MNCLDCGKELKEDEEYLCDKCYKKELEKDRKAVRERKDETNDWSESWRFRDSRGRSVFGRE